MILAPHLFRDLKTMGAEAVPETVSQASPAYVPSSTVTVSPAFTVSSARWIVSHGADAMPLAVSLPAGLTL